MSEPITPSEPTSAFTAELSAGFDTGSYDAGLSDAGLSDAGLFDAGLFDTVLVANRGEIAVRVMRTLRRLGVRSVAVYSDADAGARHVRVADAAVRLGPAPAADSYLNIERIIDAAQGTGAQAIHPGYGFLAENAAFARACAAAGLVFVGPPAEAIEAMGDKIQAKRIVAAAGIPVVPGRAEHGLSDRELTAAATEIGFPVLVKPSAGGGGKGMRRVDGPAALPAALAAARRQARAAFGDDTLLVERYVERPRHIEIQVFADSHGGVVHLGERECSLQRRHQKIIEEAPSPLLDERTRARMGASAVEVARACGYIGAGTVEFIMAGRRPEDPSSAVADRAAEFFFLEMNTRLQVEHPVTELVCAIARPAPSSRGASGPVSRRESPARPGGTYSRGLDLVELQLGVAAGERLPFQQDDVSLSGHAIEARVYAEDPDRGFLPTGGTVLALREPTGVRVDSGWSVGDVVGGAYDPMLAKVIAWDGNRGAALRRLAGALEQTTVLGVPTNIAFLRSLLGHEDVRAGRLDTGLVERHQDALAEAERGWDEHVLAAAALERLLAREPAGPIVDPWDVPDGWRLGDHAWTVLLIEAAGRAPAEVRIRGRASRDAQVSVDGGEPAPARAAYSGEELFVTYADQTRRYVFARAGDVLWLGCGGRTWTLSEQERLTAQRHEHAAGGDGVVRSPMPGTVLAVKVAEGERVAAGQPLLIVEAMKMEHTLNAPADGLVAAVQVTVGRQVALDEPMVVISSGETFVQES